MRLRDLKALWNASAIDAGRGIAGLRRRTSFTWSAFRHSASTEKLLKADPKTLLGRTIQHRQHLLLFVRAPFLSKFWDVRERIDQVVEHFAATESLGPLGNFDVRHSIELMRMPEIGPDYEVILDKPIWFHREGTLSLNLFRGNIRLFSLAFSFRRSPEGLVAVIGGIQGRSLPNALEEYRILTKLAHGLRPRDLLLELLRALCSTINVVGIEAVSDRARHHRHRYFGPDRPLPLDYDAIWTDRGGYRLSEEFFALPLEPQQRDLSEVSPNKRSMYRKRYEMLETLNARMRQACAEPTAVLRPEAD